MGFFHWKRKSTDSTQSVDGVMRTSKRAILSLREKVWKFEINPRIAKEYFQKNKLHISGTIAVVFAILMIIISGRGNANVVNFYSSQCLGGWENAKNAVGEPTLESDSKPEDYNSENSALLNNTQGDLYCGEFIGELPENTKPQKISLKLRWTIDDGEVDHSIKNFSEIIDGNEAIVNPEIIETDEPIQEAPEQESAVPEIPIEENLIPIEIIKENPDTQTETEPSALFFNIIPRANAQEEAPSDIAVPDRETGIPFSEDIVTAEDTIPIIDPMLEVDKDVDNTITESEHVDEVIDNVEDVEMIEEIAPSDQNFILIEYSTDGSSWEVFTSINRNNWNSEEFVFPDSAFNWEDVDKLQIRLTSLPSIDSPKIIYLDSFWLNVEYESIEPDPLPQPDFKKDKLLSYVESENVVAVLMDRNGEAMIWLTKTDYGKKSFEVFETNLRNSNSKPSVEIITNEGVTLEPNENQSTEDKLTETDGSEPLLVENVLGKDILLSKNFNQYGQENNIFWSLVEKSPIIELGSNMGIFGRMLFWISPSQKTLFSYNTNTGGINSVSVNEGESIASIQFSSEANEMYVASFNFFDKSFQFLAVLEGLTQE